MNTRKNVPANVRSSHDSITVDETYNTYLAHCAKEELAGNSRDPSRTASDVSNDPSSSNRMASHDRPAIDITDTSPEPEDSMEKLSTTSSEGRRESRGDIEEHWTARITRLKQWRNLFITLTAALAIALVATLAGLIFLAATRNSKSGAEKGDSISPSDGLIATSADTVKPKQLSFEEVSNTDLAIARAFADHSLYQTFYGVNYDGIDTQDCSAPGFQRSVAIDVALISRVSERIRITNDKCNLVERVLKAISDIKVKLAVTYNVKASEWADKGPEVRRILASYPSLLFDSVLVEQDDTPATSYQAYAELQAFLKRRNIDDVPVKLVDPMSEQPNPLNLANDANITRNWVLSDKARRVYTNLESPSETSEKARAMTSWVCGVSSYLGPDIAWYWSTAFDSVSAENGIFFSDRKLKPAGLPRCSDYK